MHPTRQQLCTSYATNNFQVLCHAQKCWFGCLHDIFFLLAESAMLAVPQIAECSNIEEQDALFVHLYTEVLLERQQVYT